MPGTIVYKVRLLAFQKSFHHPPSAPPVSLLFLPSLSYYPITTKLATMKAVSIILAFAATALAAGPLAPRCGQPGGKSQPVLSPFQHLLNKSANVSPSCVTASCTSGDDCCIYCDLQVSGKGTCAGSTVACIPKGCRFSHSCSQGRSRHFPVSKNGETNCVDFIAFGLSSNDCCSGKYSSGSTCA